MKRSLCLLIGKEPNIDGSNYLSLTVPTENYRALDAFIMNRFMNSEDVREFFKQQINQFLISNSHLLPPSSKYNGSIVIIETFYNQAPVKRRVLYSDVKQKLQEILDCNSFMRYYVDLKKELFSEFVRDAIWRREGQDYSKKEVKQLLKLWKEEELKEKPKGTDYLRAMLKAYEEWVIEHNKCELDDAKKIVLYRYPVPKTQMKKIQINRLKTRV